MRDAYDLAFLHVDSRRMICSPATLNPDDAQCVEQAESMLQQAEAMELPVAIRLKVSPPGCTSRPGLKVRPFACREDDLSDFASPLE